ncbi:MAG: hypothetical protein F6J87_03775 [Spirulina sp. SIO3F2]|nr:hypothetical protein [Spirulina sp. SIO3F2]
MNQQNESAKIRRLREKFQQVRDSRISRAGLISPAQFLHEAVSGKLGPAYANADVLIAGSGDYASLLGHSWTGIVALGQASGIANFQEIEGGVGCEEFDLVCKQGRSELEADIVAQLWRQLKTPLGIKVHASTCYDGAPTRFIVRWLDGTECEGGCNLGDSGRSKVFKIVRVLWHLFKTTDLETTYSEPGTAR